MPDDPLQIKPPLALTACNPCCDKGQEGLDCQDNMAFPSCQRLLSPKGLFMARYSFFVAALFVISSAGCGSSTPEKKAEKEPSETVKPEGGTAKEATGTGEKPKEEPAKAFVLGDMIKAFDPPTLEELNAKVQWVDRPVIDAAPLLRERQAKEKQLATVEEALKLHNNTPQDNEKILSGLGRLPSKEGKEVNWDATINRHSFGDVNSTNPVAREFDCGIRYQRTGQLRPF